MLEKASAGVPVSAYIRSRLFGDGVRPRRTREKHPVRDHRMLARLLGTLGEANRASNLSELADAAQTGSLPVTPDTEASIRQACAHVAHMRCELLKALGLMSDD